MLFHEKQEQARESASAVIASLDRELAVESVENGGVAVPAVNELVGNVSEGIQWQKRFTRWAVVLPASILATVAASLSTLHFHLGTEAFSRVLAEPIIFMVVAVFFLGAPLLAALAIVTHASKLSARSRDIAAMNDVQVVGALIDLLGMENLKVRTNAMRTLTRLLPDMSSEEAETLTHRQRERLVKWTGMNPDYFLYKDLGSILRPPKLDREVNRVAIDFRVAVLQSYARIGGALELDTVRRLANSTSPNQAQQRLREIALETLPALEARVEAASRRASLLRPVAFAADSATLLLPVEAAKSPAENLLRPSDP